MTTTLWILVAIFAWPAIIFISLICFIVHYIRKDNNASKSYIPRGSKRKPTITPLNSKNIFKSKKVLR